MTRSRLRLTAVYACLLIPPGSACAATVAQADAAYKNSHYEEAFKAFLPAAQKGDAFAQLRLGEMYSLGQGVKPDQGKAASWYERAAASGNLEALNALGSLHYDRREFTAALKLFLQAARSGSAAGDYNAGNMYYNGDGVTRDYAKAARWYLKAAQGGDPRAQNNLGYMYAEGVGLPKDDALAYRWYRQAAENGSPQARTALGGILETGRGTPVDLVEAYKWYLLAAAQGDKEAIRCRQSLGPRLGSDQVSQAEERIAHMKASKPAQKRP